MTEGPALDLGIEGIENAHHIGSGGAADVYRAEQPRLGRTVAIKVLRANTSDESRSRFEREAQTLGRLSNHPGIVTLHEAGLTSLGQPFLMMEFCPAGTLADRTAREGPMAWDEACRIVANVSILVDEAHQAGVLHRDLKPANVLIDERGQYLIADFGVAALSDTGNFSAAADFTPGYAPPETLKGDAATPAGDVYSLAATAHALITARVPFEATDTSSNNVLAWIRRIDTEPPEDLRPLGVPDGVATLIEQAMSKEPAGRPSTLQLASSLAAAGRGEVDEIDVRRLPPMPPVSKDPETTAVDSLLPQKPTSNRPPMPSGAAPPMPPGEPVASLGPDTGSPPTAPEMPIRPPAAPISPAEPVLAEPIVAEPIVTEPLAPKRVTTEPIAPEPTATEPIAPEPTATEPLATEPLATAPVVAPAGPTTIDQPAPRSDDEKSRKGLLVGLGLLFLAIVGLGALLINSLRDGETTAATVPSSTASTTSPTTTNQPTTSTAPATTVVVEVEVDATAKITKTSVVLSGNVPDAATASAIRAAVSSYYGRDQITDQLTVDSDATEVKLTVSGSLSDEDRIDELTSSFNDIDNVEVDNQLKLITTTTTTAAPATTRPPVVTTRRPATTRRATTAAPTAPPTTRAPIETQVTNSGIGG